MKQMKRLLSFFFTFILLSACSGEPNDSPENISEGGLPQSQRTQEDSAAGVNFNAASPFKSLSDSANDRDD
jgi:hypothetical protein